MDVPEIPADILEAADAVFQTEIRAGQMGGSFIKERIARAILAERERAAKIVETMPTKTTYNMRREIAKAIRA